MDQLDALFNRLATAVARVRPGPAPSLEVGEIVGTFAPYKRVRRDLGLDAAEDYEHLVMRLVSGERGLVFADEVMQDDLKAELASGNPDLGALTTYRRTKVTLSQEAVRQALDAMPPQDPASEPESMPKAAPKGAPKAAPKAAPRTPSSRGEGAGQATGATTATGSPRASAPGRPGCRYCAHPLPVGRRVVFCPFCGQNLTVRRCSACSAEIEEGWKFCISCGRSGA